MKRRWFFQLLGVLALTLLLGVILTGCEALILASPLIVGGLIGNAFDHVFIGIIVGGIIGFIIIRIIISDGGSSSSGSNSNSSSSYSGSSSSSSYSSSSSGSSSSGSSWYQRRMNEPHTCGTCGYWLSRGVCRRDGSPKSGSDKCSNWE